MSSFGESLKQQRQSQGKSVEEIAEATGIRLDLLTALEQDAFEALPGRGFGKLYIRAYAEVLGFDPRPLIQEYDRAVSAREAAPEAASGPAKPRPIEAALARWRQERMAAAQERVEEDDEDDEDAEIEEEIEPEEIEEPPAPEPADPVEVAPMAEPPIPSAPSSGSVPPAVTESAEPVAPWEPPAPAVRTPSRRLWTWSSMAAVLFLAVALALLWSKEPKQAQATPPPQVQLPTPPPPPVASAPVPEPAPTPREIPPSEPTHLTITESAVGLRASGTRVEGPSDRYTVGQRVSFVTRVSGGKPGERIRHVWMRDGKVEQSIRLRLGASSYRTYSTKTLGRPGAWAVEARDEQGSVLARANFTCTP